ncbi:alpha-D-xyloside xylohydrolase [Aequitasia blattaphilus]|uniref:DUF5110 domain-containing protein n=1 Tax=Aequitasia blattaphilus TaxID=2949332 RepID=A0ABT1EB70_9FIRM|nr:TIM-barrel domain-containing protein [Aequitasia blattaphilus]MCP1103062.1 DUF5110 domain-containing protein [Aequitasia blattaphilus]MCR8615702.1 DUF5110 domain-containing protein [Aequitasia blattaphilus]
MKIKIDTLKGSFRLYGVQENIIRCVCTKREEEDLSPIGIERGEGVPLMVQEEEEKFYVQTKRIFLEIEKATGIFTWKEKGSGKMLLEEDGKELREIPLAVYTTGGEEPDIETVQTVDGERNFVRNLREEIKGSIYKGKLKFKFQEEESIHGLGQGEEGIYNYRGKTQYLYQHNMRIPMPFFVSSNQYGILFDTTSLMYFNDDERGSYMYLDAIRQLDYYFIAGTEMDEVIAGYRELTGRASMLPKYAFGYVQSKEAYHTQKEVLEVAAEYRKRNIPLDLIVQDWNTWEEGKWGNKKVDKERYPNLSEMNQKLHDMNVHSMVSVWPNTNSGTENYAQMKKAGCLLNDLSTYDAFKEEGRTLYWQQANEELFSGGFDAWWCDSTEPFSGPDWNGEFLREPWERFQLVGEEHKKFLGTEKANFYATLHSKGIYENQRKEKKEKRVLNLTRSGYASIQKYGAVLWSGDITATWDTLQRQIREGLNMAMSGIPYWTLDVGGFFTVHEKWKNRGCNCNTDSTPKWFWQGDYEEGVADPAYRELYVRWLGYALFLPMFRSHGTDTPREIWNFGEKGDLFYDSIASIIRMRYRLMPYIYSLAGGVHFNHETMLRSLLFDFPHDKEAAQRSDTFLLGRNILVCPVTKSLEKDEKWECYLPKSCQWTHLFTGEKYEGGQVISVSAPLGQVPAFVRSGAILPMEVGLTYATEKVDTPFEIHIYEGADAEFLYYEDAGDGYAYEEGIYNAIPMKWNDAESILTIGEAKHRFENGLVNRKCVAILKEAKSEFIYQGEAIDVCL